MSAPLSGGGAFDFGHAGGARGTQHRRAGGDITPRPPRARMLAWRAKLTMRDEGGVGGVSSSSLLFLPPLASAFGLLVSFPPVSVDLATTLPVTTTPPELSSP